MPDSNACCSWFCPWINSCCVRKWLSWDLAVKMGVKRFTRNEPASIHEVFYFHSRRLDRLQTTVQEAAHCTVWRQILATDAASDASFPLDSKVFRVWHFSFLQVSWYDFYIGNRLRYIGSRIYQWSFWSIHSSSTFPGFWFYLRTYKCWCINSELLISGSVKHLMLYLTSLTPRQASQVFQVFSPRWPKTTLSPSGGLIKTAFLQSDLQKELRQFFGVPTVGTIEKENCWCKI